MLAEQHSGALRGYGVLEGIVVDIFCKRHLEMHERQRIIAAEIRPAVPERTAVYDERLVEGSCIILHDGAHRTGAGAGIDYGAAAFAVDEVKQDTFRLEINAGELFRTHVWDGFGAYFSYALREVSGECVRMHFHIHFSILRF